MSTRSAQPLRTRIYVDGYNLYYGCLKGTSHKWLDLITLFERHVLPSAATGPGASAFELQQPAIRYYTAEILDKVAKAGESLASQQRYHTALKKLYPDRIECIKGYYSLLQSKAKVVDAGNPKRWPRECQEILVWKIEEKQSDVSLALQVYHDAMTGEVDHVVVVTNDTDIAPALAMVRRHTNAQIGLVIPTRDHERIPNTELAAHAHWVRTHITDDELRASQLPRVVGRHRPTIKPETWYERPDLLEKILALAIPICGGRGPAFRWMEQPNERLGGEAPIELVRTDAGADRVAQYIAAYQVREW